MNNSIIHLESVSKDYSRGSETIHALHNVDLSVNSGDFTVIVGYSGSGKTTLMNIIGCLDRPTRGKVSINGNEIQDLKEKELVRLRKTIVGFVFQQFFLIPTLTVLQNVMLPALFTHKDVKDRAQELLSIVGLANRLDHRPSQLSGGEMQRVAIARSIINNPLILLADEPTGNLDSHNAQNIISLFESLNKNGLTIVMVTHNPELVKHCSKTVHIEDGSINNA